MRRRAEQGAGRQLGDELLELGLRLEDRIGMSTGEMGNAFATGSPGWLSERTPASSNTGCPAISRSSSPAT